MVNSPSVSVCVYCSGSRAQFRTMLSCSSHITVLSFKTSWWHGFSQGQTLSFLSLYQIPCWLQRKWFSSQCGSVLADNTCAGQGTGAKLHNRQWLSLNTRNMDVVRTSGSKLQCSFLCMLVWSELISGGLVIVRTFCLHSPHWQIIATNGSGWTLCSWDPLLY